MFTSSEQQTIDFAKDYAKKLKGKEVILLQGNLGAGKSVFVRGLAKGLGIKTRITSPTFVLMKVYNSKKLKLVHVDAYRVEAKDLFAIGLDEYLNKKNCVVVIEWGEKIEKSFKKMNVKFRKIKIKIKNNSREIVL